MIAAPEKKPCKQCSSLECGSVSCRFHDTYRADSPEEEIDERLEELREFDRHPERYR